MRRAMTGKRSVVARARIAVSIRAILPLSAFLGLLVLAACSFIPRDQFTAKEQSIAVIPGIPGARFWTDSNPDELKAFLREAFRRQASRKQSTFADAIAATGRFDVLALSGGAYDGAYGAGVVAGWTAAGTRPRFTIVTGVSAGALIAPLAFLGPSYDKEIAFAFQGGVAEVLGDIGGIFSLLGTSDVRRDTLVALVDKFVDMNLIAAVAAEHAKGRRLYVVTSNLDAQRGVVWDMGAIASSGHPNARTLFRDVLVASASIPGVFSPTYIEAEADGHRFREMHVDGGAITQVFVLPDALLASGMGLANPNNAPTQVWVVINNHLTPQFEIVDAGLLPGVSRSFSTLIKSSSKETLFATERATGPDRFNLTYIDERFDEWLKVNYGPDVTPGFNAPYMTALFRYGYAKAVSGRLWSHQVPLPGLSSAAAMKPADHR